MRRLAWSTVCVVTTALNLSAPPSARADDDRFLALCAAEERDGTVYVYGYVTADTEVIIQPSNPPRFSPRVPLETRITCTVSDGLQTLTTAGQSIGPAAWTVGQRSGMSRPRTVTCTLWARYTDGSIVESGPAPCGNRNQLSPGIAARGECNFSRQQGTTVVWGYGWGMRDDLDTLPDTTQVWCEASTPDGARVVALNSTSAPATTAVATGWLPLAAITMCTEVNTWYADGYHAIFRWCETT